MSWNVQDVLPKWLWLRLCLCFHQAGWCRKSTVRASIISLACHWDQRARRLERDNIEHHWKRPSQTAWWEWELSWSFMIICDHSWSFMIYHTPSWLSWSTSWCWLFGSVPQPLEEVVFWTGSATRTRPQKISKGTAVYILRIDTMYMICTLYTNMWIYIHRVSIDNIALWCSIYILYMYTHWVYYTVSAPNEVKFLFQFHVRGPCEADLLRSSCHSLNQIPAGLGADFFRFPAWDQQTGSHPGRDFLVAIGILWIWKNLGEWKHVTKLSKISPKKNWHCNGLLWRLHTPQELLAVC